MRSFMSPGLLQLSVYLGRTDAVRTVQSDAARLITATRRSDHIMPVLRQLHGYLYASASSSSLRRSFIEAWYLADDCRLVADACKRRLCSTASRTCVVNDDADIRHLRR